MSIAPPWQLSEPLPVCCIARSIALGARDLLLLHEEDASAEGLELLFLRVRPCETTEWVEYDGIVAGHGLPFCRERCHQIERCREEVAHSEAEYTALYRLGLGVHGAEVELVVLVVGAENLPVCGLCHRHDGCRTGQEAAVGTGRPYVEAEED